MSLIERINADFMAAFKARETGKKTFLGVIKGEIQNKAPNPTDENVLMILKSTRKALEQSLAFGDDSAEIELEYLEGYFPSQMDEKELSIAVNDFIITEGLTGPKDMGRIMGHLKGKYGGQYDGKMASNIVKESLASLV